jgi:hypothetical protein
MNEIIVKKDEENELPIPHIWRPTLKAIVDAFVIQDYELSVEIKNVSPVSKSTSKQIEDYIQDYGEALIDLPEDTWETSVYIYDGGYWRVLLDLYTKNEGLSDLVLSVEVKENRDAYIIDIKAVYVP